MATDLLSADATTPLSCSSARLAAAESTVASPINGAGQGSGVVSDRVRRDASSAEATRTFAAVVSDYVQLTKPRIVVMILVTTTATAMLGAGGVVAALPLCWLLLATAAVAGSAGAANQVWERVIDCRMTRTAVRPLPSGACKRFRLLFTAVCWGSGERRYFIFCSVRFRRSLGSQPG